MRPAAARRRRAQNRVRAQCSSRGAGDCASRPRAARYAPQPSMPAAWSLQVGRRSNMQGGNVCVTGGGCGMGAAVRAVGAAREHRHQALPADGHRRRPQGRWQPPRGIPLVRGAWQAGCHCGEALQGPGPPRAARVIPWAWLFLRLYPPAMHGAGGLPEGRPMTAPLLQHVAQLLGVLCVVGQGPSRGGVALRNRGRAVGTRVDCKAHQRASPVPTTARPGTPAPADGRHEPGSRQNDSAAAHPHLGVCQVLLEAEALVRMADLRVSSPVPCAAVEYGLAGQTAELWIARLAAHLALQHFGPRSGAPAPSSRRWPEQMAARRAGTAMLLQQPNALHSPLHAWRQLRPPTATCRSWQDQATMKQPLYCRLLPSHPMHAVRRTLSSTPLSWINVRITAQPGARKPRPAAARGHLSARRRAAAPHCPCVGLFQCAGQVQHPVLCLVCLLLSSCPLLDGLWERGSRQGGHHMVLGLDS